MHRVERQIRPKTKYTLNNVSVIQFILKTIFPAVYCLHQAIIRGCCSAKTN